MLALSAPQYIFGSPGGIPAGRSPPECQTPCMDRPIRPCALSQICSAISEEMHPEQTDRQSGRQTANLISPLPNYHGGDN